MSKKTVPNQAEQTNPEDEAPELSPEILDKIKHPRNMADVIREQSPAERRGNLALVPEMLEQPIDEMISFTKE